MNRAAIFSDGTGNFITPAKPREYDTVTLRCRTAREDAEEVLAVVNGIPKQMKKESETDYFDVYAVEIALGKDKTDYFFEIRKRDEIVFYNKQGAIDGVNPYFNFAIMPGYDTPDWAKGAVMYQIFVDRFYNGDKSNDVVDNEYTYIENQHVSQVKDWGKMPASMGVREFYGGDLKGILKKLDYLQDLGVEVLYLNPIFVSPSNHKYDTQDYDYIDPHYGVIKEDGGEPLPPGDADNSHATKYIQRVVNKVNLEASNEFFAHFVEEVHKRGMKVILDGVFNHCGSFNKWLDREKIYDKDVSYDKGAYLREDSPYHDFFHFYPDGSWPDNTNYDSWWGNDTLPKLNYEDSEKLYSYIMKIASKWVSAPYHIDGWRLDVAADLGHTQEFNHKFWRDFRDAVKRANPEAIILAEHYGDPSAWLDGTQWDTVMNYDAFMEPVSWFLTGMEKHSDVHKQEMQGNADAFFFAMTDFGARFTTQSAQVAMNELSNHDHSRFLTRTNHVVGRTAFAGPMAAEMGINPAVMRLAVVIQMTWVGAPTVYYGDEAGVCGWTDPDNRRSYPWGREDKQMLGFHKEMIRIHKDYQVFKTGSLIYLHNEYGLIGYGRFDEKDQAFVLVQVDGYERDVEVEVWKLGVPDGSQMVRMVETSGEGYHLAAELRQVENGRITVHLKPNGAVVWKSIDWTA
ncbi:MAG: glycoside hydrolase family 13 protein [Lachnospiraceae bacterium]|nr:glycoside hydrolase family 13 protein [Lachnospiraceae bacterium]